MTEVLSQLRVCVDVAVSLPVEGLFSYLLPVEWEKRVQAGVRVRVPFRNREIIGYLVGQRPAREDEHLKSVIQILDEAPVLSPAMLELTQWISSYYGSSWGEAIENALPRWVKYGKKALDALARGKQEEDGKVASHIPEEELKLSGDQIRALDFIENALNTPHPKPILLYGVTGSGKSEIYIRAIREVLKRNQAAICLVPEIALTEQLRRFFLHHFGNELEILHSKLSDGQRFLAWKRLEKGARRVVLGPRSAVFAPVPNLGLIVMDEEHEGTYKQETTPRYHAREVAAWRARQENALFLMGTATPSLESMFRAEHGEMDCVRLETRIDEKQMPRVQVLDLKAEINQRMRVTILTPRLAAELESNLQKKEGTLLLLNRRGFSTHINCPKCGWVETCSSCHVSLTFHQEDEILLCHYCNYQKAVSRECSQCQTPVLRFGGFGTEKVESEVAHRFPAARIARMDTDSVRKKGSHEEILKDFRDRKYDILIGTQMIAKGFDFPHVTLVGVILADVGLLLPDFRSAERTFQLLTQVAGRAGRGKAPGRVFIQTFSPDHSSIRFAKDHDYMSFYKQESRERFEYRYPPFCRLINIIVRSKLEKPAYLHARAIRDSLKKNLLPSPSPLPQGEGKGEGVRVEGLFHQSSSIDSQFLEIIGPAPLPFYKLRGHYRWHIMIKFPRFAELSVSVKAILSKLKKPSNVAFALDVDPLNIL